MFEGADIMMLHRVVGKNAVGLPHALVSIEPEPFDTSAGTLLASRGQNQILMKVVVRSIAYLHQGGRIPLKVSSSAVRMRILWMWILHAPSAAILVECWSVVVGLSGLHTAASVEGGDCVAVDSGGGAVGPGERAALSTIIQRREECPYPVWSRPGGIMHPENSDSCQCVIR